MYVYVYVCVCMYVYSVLLTEDSIQRNLSGTLPKIVESPPVIMSLGVLDQSSTAQKIFFTLRPDYVGNKLYLKGKSTTCLLHVENLASCTTLLTENEVYLNINLA
jgi:hypothetical protein